MGDMAEALDGYRVIAFDRPPFGLTSRSVPAILVDPLGYTDLR